MKKYTPLLWGILFCIPLYLQAQRLDKKRIRIADAFVKDMFYSSLSSKDIADRYMIFQSSPGIQRDTIFRNFVEGLREYQKLSFDSIQNNYQILPYAQMSHIPDLDFYTQKKGEKNVYGVVANNKVYTYLLFDKKEKYKIVSCFSVRKGRNDYAFFISF